MVVEISSAVLARLRDEADQDPLREVCGLLTGSPIWIADMLRCRNVAADPRISFEIDPSQLIAAHRAERAGGPTVVGCYHSHPVGPAAPSVHDAAAAAPDGSIWIILAGHETGCFRAVENGHYHGRFDAVELRSVTV